MNAAARIAEYTVTRPKRVLIGWLGLVAALITLGTLVGTRQLWDNDAAVGQSRQALDILTSAGLTDPAKASWSPTPHDAPTTPSSPP